MREDRETRDLAGAATFERHRAEGMYDHDWTRADLEDEWDDEDQYRPVDAGPPPIPPIEAYEEDDDV